MRTTNKNKTDHDDNNKKGVDVLSNPAYPNLSAYNAQQKNATMRQNKTKKKPPSHPKTPSRRGREEKGEGKHRKGAPPTQEQGRQTSQPQPKATQGGLREGDGERTLYTAMWMKE